MFTGIVRERGTVVAREGGTGGLRVVVRAPETAASTRIGDSVAIAGVCLTAVEVGADTVAFEAIPETLSRTSLGSLAEHREINVEPALRAGDPLGGHFVQGHVDAVGRVRSAAPEGDGRRLWIDAPTEVLRYCVEKGSVTVDGVSLTVAALDGTGFSVALVPHTLAVTTLGALSTGDPVNLEADLLAKYAERLGTT